MDLGIISLIFMILLLFVPLIIEIITEKKYRKEVEEILNQEDEE